MQVPGADAAEGPALDLRQMDGIRSEMTQKQLQKLNNQNTEKKIKSSFPNDFKSIWPDFALNADEQCVASKTVVKVSINQFIRCSIRYIFSLKSILHVSSYL